MDKQKRFERDYSAGKVSKNLWDYIPAKYTKYVADAFADHDGYYVFLTTGKGIRAYTIADLIHGMRAAIEAFCNL